MKQCNACLKEPASKVLTTLAILEDKQVCSKCLNVLMGYFEQINGAYTDEESKVMLRKQSWIALTEKMRNNG